MTSATGATTITDDNDKYGKRRRQRLSKRRTQVLMFAAGVLALLAFLLCYLTLASTAASPHSTMMRSILGQSHRLKDRYSSILRRNQHDGEDVDPIDTLDTSELDSLLEDLNDAVLHNRPADSGATWIRPELLISLKSKDRNPLMSSDSLHGRNRRALMDVKHDYFHARRNKKRGMDWEYDLESVNLDAQTRSDYVDYTKHEYTYPTLQDSPPMDGSYPPLRPLQDMLADWSQDGLDHPPTPFREVLMHFDFQNAEHLAQARLYRDAKLPFKFINVPELMAASETWTDEYLSTQFDTNPKRKQMGAPKQASGTAQESRNNFFAFFTAPQWDPLLLGLPPTRTSDWKFKTWSKHAKYADAVGLSPEQPHFYYQAGVDKEERHRSIRTDWCFISRDLPSWSSTTPNDIVFDPSQQKGIQCRFGERGVTAATHFDSGRNMVGMITGAKRYILSPPKQCPKLGIVTHRGNPIYRHSLLNFGHMNSDEFRQPPRVDTSSNTTSTVTTPFGSTPTHMSERERAWLERAATAESVETVLKSGEVLYIPSHWFHYIVSLQKSAQCNVRSGIDHEGSPIFGGPDHVGAERCGARYQEG